ncbi:MAG: hypothetical protein K8F27_10125 [Sulfuricellaceae bacterium]|nr:hypothetical protein [Sulfuricellaceae bacterium]
MNKQEILSILRGERGASPNMGIEEDDLLANAFFDLSDVEKEAFWPELSDAMKSLVADREGMPFYLAARFIYGMGEIKPPRLPRKKSLFNFLLDAMAEKDQPAQLAGTLLTLLVLKMGKPEFWGRQIAASLDSLEATQDANYAMAAVVYAFLGYNRCTTISATDWSRLFSVLSRLPSLPRMEMLELLVGVEKEAKRPGELEEELDVGLGTLRTSIRNNEESTRIDQSLAPVFKTWLEKNEPRQAIAAWLSKELRPGGAERRGLSPRRFIERIGAERTNQAVA